MKEFIDAFKKSSYYQELFKSSEILAIFLLGSTCTGIVDDNSDYDITILTLNGDYIDSSKYEYLMYKDKKVHWYYHPIKDVFSLAHKIQELKVLCPIQLRNLCDDFIIYENPKYKDSLQSLYKIKTEISKLGMYLLYNMRKDYVGAIINNGYVGKKHYSKWLYHLCLSSYYIMNEEPNKDFLRVLKRIKWEPVPDEYKQLAIERLQIYKNYIEQNPLNITEELDKLYKQLKIQY